ncbi:exocyst complex component EXO70H1-like [Cucurbita pepo subsp. pepo]|uniref:exocyst complex component EXO70H1-like n=1 Tax=Cucurbita pepo subsp. pepo TaxID=3664 RepID=UPI000C9D2E6E|nr:exocyst complex component EXO70H1-like [Cucurbita pepo subsp. pepo]
MPQKGMRTVFFKSPPSSSSSSIPGTPSSSHSSRPTLSDSMVEETIEVAESFVARWRPDLVAAGSLFQGDDREEARQFIKAVKNLHAAMHCLASRHSSSERLVRAHDLMRVGMERLQKEFYRILSVNREYLYPESVSSVQSPMTVSARSSVSDFEVELEDEFRFANESITEVERVSMSAMADLKAIADCMISTGYGKECVKIYKTVRKSIIDESLYNLGIEKLSFSKVQKMDWEVLEIKIKIWLRGVKTAVKSLFEGERILCDHVFSASVPIRESCFAQISKDGAMILFEFPELAAKYKKTPEKIFITLDLYEAIADLWPEINYIFSSTATSMVQSQAINSLIKLGQNIRTLIADFEMAIQKESSKTPVPKGGVHPLTRYVMNYISFLSDYSGILNDIMTDSPLPTQLSMPESYYGTPKQDDNPITLHFAWLILVLLCKLDGKAEHYNDVALSYLFLANNLRYIVDKVRNSNLRFLLGDEWIERHESKIKLYSSKYMRIGWSGVFSSLPTDVVAEISPEDARESFRNFNRAFEETYRKQTSWIVPNQKLRDELKISLAKELGALYGEFYARNRGRARRVSGSDPVVRLSPDDLGNYLSDLFYGSGSESVGSASSNYSSSHSSPSSRGRFVR